MIGVKQVTRSYLLKEIGICACTLTVYLCRPEFSHIEKVFRGRGKEFLYKNVTQKDIERIKQLLHARKTKRKKDED